jgi:hypothetical protein
MQKYSAAHKSCHRDSFFRRSAFEMGEFGKSFESWRRRGLKDAQCKFSKVSWFRNKFESRIEGKTLNYGEINGDKVANEMKTAIAEVYL